MTVLKKPEWPFYAAWVLLPGLCLPAAFILYFLIIRAVNFFVGDFIYVDGVRHITEDYLLSYIFLPALGLLLAFVQFWLLRGCLPRMVWWVPATYAGWLLGLLMGFGYREAAAYFGAPAVYYESAYMIGGLLLMGLAVGVGQWLLLRRRLPKAGWWIVASVAGWGLSAVITRLHSGNALGQSGLIVSTWLQSCATAVALAYLLNLSPPPDLQEPLPNIARLS